jgi:Nuclear transport factor 2 (NTF2) domain
MMNSAQPAIETSASSPMAIEGITEPVIAQYFESLNAADFALTASLFAEQGVMIPPFDDPQQGPEAIAHYLDAEARGMQLHPLNGTSTVLDNGDVEINVAGKVQTSLFGVHVAWYFVLDSEAKILAVRVKLLASLEELLKLKR